MTEIPIINASMAMVAMLSASLNPVQILEHEPDRRFMIYEPEPIQIERLPRGSKSKPGPRGGKPRNKAACKAQRAARKKSQ